MTTIDRAIRAELLAAYEDVMWLARRDGVTPSMARAWYTHIVAGRMSRHHLPENKSGVVFCACAIEFQSLSASG